MAKRTDRQDTAQDVADAYHALFFSVWGVGFFKKNKKVILLVGIAFSLFVVAIINAFLAMYENNRVLVWMPLLFLILSEWLFFSLAGDLRKRRQRITVQLVQSQIPTDVTCIEALKVMWFRHRLGLLRVDYLPFAERLERIVILQSKAGSQTN